MNKRADQNGSIVTFVIVGVVLAAVVAGGVYLVNQRGKQTSHSQPATSQPAPSSSTPSGSSSRNDSQSQPSTSQNSPPSSTGSASTSERLPTTGPAEDGLRLLFVGIFVGIATAYVRSRQQRRQVFSL